MKRLVISLAAAALLVAGSGAAAMAAPMLADQTPQPGWVCPAWSGSFGNYDPTTNPTVKLVAGKLGIGADALVSELKSGKSVADVAKEKNVDEQSLIDALMAPQNDMMATRVKYGYLTQDQANQALQYMSQAIKNQLETKGFFAGGSGSGTTGPGYFGPGMMGGGFGGGAYGPGMMGGGFGRGFGGMMGGFRGGPWQ